MALPVPKAKEGNAKDNKRSPPGNEQLNGVQSPTPIQGFSYTWSTAATCAPEAEDPPSNRQ